MTTSYANRPIGILTEEDRLVHQAKSGNAYAFAQLYDAYVEPIYRYISARVATDQAAEAITVQVFFKAWEQLDQYQVFESAFIMRLYSIAQNQVLAYYFKHKQLKPLLQTLFLLDRGREIMPSSTFSAFARFALIEYARSHPRRQQGIALTWRMAATFAMLVVALLVTETVHAQSALPGDIDYGWKRTSELAWRTLAFNPVAADITLSERRLNEWIAVANDPALNTGARNSYRAALSRLKASRDVEIALIVPALQSQQQTLKNAGLPTSELDNYLTEMLTPVVAPMTGVQPTATEVPSIATPIATPIAAPIATEVPQITTDVQPTIGPNNCAPNCGNSNSSASTNNGKKDKKDKKDHNEDGHKDNGKGHNK